MSGYGTDAAWQATLKDTLAETARERDALRERAQELTNALREADEAASEAHDAIYAEPFDQKAASDAIPSRTCESLLGCRCSQGSCRCGGGTAMSARAHRYACSEGYHRWKWSARLCRWFSRKRAAGGETP